MRLSVGENASRAQLSVSIRPGKVLTAECLRYGTSFDIREGLGVFFFLFVVVSPPKFGVQATCIITTCVVVVV